MRDCELKHNTSMRLVFVLQYEDVLFSQRETMSMQVK